MNNFKIKLDASDCISVTTGSAFFGREKFPDTWKYSSLEFESGKIYALISEHGEGCMYLSYLLGGRVNLNNCIKDGLKIYINSKEALQSDLSSISWNLEPAEEKYKNYIVKKSIEKALVKNNLTETFSEIQKKFILTEARENRKLRYLSSERWRASAALGYAENKKIFFAPYKTSSFYFQMIQCGLVKVLNHLTEKSALIILPAGSDKVIKFIADECVYLDYHNEYINNRLEQYFK